MTNSCTPTIIKLRQGDDSNFNDNQIIFHINSNYSLAGWKAKFTLQEQTWEFDNIESQIINLIISAEETNKMEPGTCYGWLQFIDANGRHGTVFAQKFQILKREVF